MKYTHSLYCKGLTKLPSPLQAKSPRNIFVRTLKPNYFHSIYSLVHLALCKCKWAVEENLSVKNSKTWLYVRTAKIDKCVAIETNPSISFTLMTILQSLWKEREIQSLIRSRLSISQLKLMWVNFTKYSEVHWPLFHGVSLLPRADICFFVDFFFLK